jgi:glycosyltransferase involved in cell wall biosynthesis
MSQCFRDATLLYVPSEAEAMGIMYCDACAYGLPVIARDTGGVASVVLDSINGKLLSPSASDDEYASAILDVVHSRESYNRYSLAAYDYYSSTLSWRQVGSVLGQAVREITKEAK